MVALFGASDPYVWGPWDNRSGSSYKRISGVQIHGIHRVISHTDQEIFYKGGRKYSKGMMSIPVHQVILEFDDIFESLLEKVTPDIYCEENNTYAEVTE